jgi:hypothetical protein
MKKLLILAAIIMLTATQTIAASASALKIEKAMVAKAKQVYKCKYVYSPIIIDGIISDDAWKYAKSVDFLLCPDLAMPSDKTRGWVMWDAKYLYVAYKAYDNDIWSLYTKRDSWCYEEDCLEIFFWPDASKGTYYNFEINIIGTIYDSYNRKRFAGGSEIKRWSAWNAENAKVATHIYGILNNPYDIDKYVTMELRIPFSDLPSLKGKSPKNGDLWKFTLARCNYSVDLQKGHEETCSAAISRYDFHHFYEYQPLMFIK